MKSMIIFSAFFLISIGCDEAEFKNRLENSTFSTFKIYPSPCDANSKLAERFVCDPFDVLKDRSGLVENLKKINENSESPIYLIIVRNIFPISQNVDEFAEKLLQRYQRDKKNDTKCKIGGLLVVQTPTDESQSTNCASAFYVLDNATESQNLLANQAFRIYGDDGCDDIAASVEKIVRGMLEAKNEKPPIFGVTPPEESSGIHFDDSAVVKNTKTRNPAVSAAFTMAICIVFLLVFFMLGWFCNRDPNESIPSRKIVPAKKS